MAGRLKSKSDAETFLLLPPALLAADGRLHSTNAGAITASQDCGGIGCGELLFELPARRPAGCLLSVC